jgi:predicted enzyme related to lactoylglutathione lyase
MIKSGAATVMVSSMERAVDFYTRVLGLKLMTPAGSDWAEVETPGLTIGLHLAKHGAKPGAQGAISIGFDVAGSLETAMATLRERGVRFEGPVVDNPEVKLAFFGDTDGNTLYLCEVKHQ